MCIEKKERIVADKDFIVYKVVRKYDYDNEYSFIFMWGGLYMCEPPTEHGYSAFLSLSDAVKYAAAVALSLQTLNLTILEIKIRKNDVYWKGKVGKDYIGGELNSAIAIMSPVEIGDEVC